MTNREKLIELLTEEKDGMANIKEIDILLNKSPLGNSCPRDFKCEDANDSCVVCAAKWLNEEAK